MQWDSYSPVCFQGQSYGMKSASFGPYLELPKRVTARMELAIGSSTAPREAMRMNGWAITDPLTVTKSPATYQEFIQSSKGEFTVAKHGAILWSRSGWFSERSAAYLASARPVITQDTGFGHVLPTGNGLLCYDSPEAAADCIHGVTAEYERHCRSAAFSQEFFDSGHVLTDLLARAMAGDYLTGADK